jgi:hypothetical protein
MKKLFTLITLLVTIVMGAKAQETVVTSPVKWTTAPGTKKGSVTSSLNPSVKVESSPCDGLYWTGDVSKSGGYIKIANGDTPKAHFNIPANTSGTLYVTFASSSTSDAQFKVKLGEDEVYVKNTSSQDTQTSEAIVINNTSGDAAAINFGNDIADGTNTL